jgi:hypothetical protein
MIEARDHLAPNAKLGIGGFGRGYALPFMDKRFPKSIPFADMESRAIWTPAGAPLEDFGGMGERERILIPRLDDDSDMFGPQFNLNLYYKDRVFEGSVENGITGFAGQLNRIRGTEQNYLYLAGGAWNPHLTPKEFYTEYSRRVFGERAQKDVMAAFDTLEENEEYLGWLGKFNFICCGVIPEVGTAYGLYMQPNPFDGPEKWEPFITNSKEQVQYFTHSIELLESALANFRQAQKTVAPQGRQELEYLENKTESYAMLLKTLIAARKGYITFYEAFQLRKSPADPAFIKRLDESMALFTETRQLGRQTTEKFAQIIDHPSDMGVLYRANLFLVTGLELVEQTMQDIVNYHHGKEYTKLVPWDKIYYGFPQLAVH